jgi:hypothetical protein
MSLILLLNEYITIPKGVEEERTNLSKFENYHLAMDF